MRAAHFMVNTHYYRGADLAIPEDLPP